MSDELPDDLSAAAPRTQLAMPEVDVGNGGECTVGAVVAGCMRALLAVVAPRS